MAKEMRIEDGDLLIHDEAEQRFTIIAMATWSEGAVAPSSGRPHGVWYRPLMGKKYQHFESEAQIPPFVPATQEQMDALRDEYYGRVLSQGEFKLIVINKNDMQL